MIVLIITPDVNVPGLPGSEQYSYGVIIFVITPDMNVPGLPGSEQYS